MADVKESALSTASDCAYVRALDSNGNSIRISKADLASVVGGLLGTDNMFRYTGDNPKTLDFNEIKTNGIYFFTNDDGKTYTNFPPMFTNDQSGTVKGPYAALKIYTSGDAVLQECVFYNGKTAVRHYNQVSKSWADWKQYSLSE